MELTLEQVIGMLPMIPNYMISETDYNAGYIDAIHETEFNIREAFKKEAGATAL